MILTAACMIAHKNALVQILKVNTNDVKEFSCKWSVEFVIMQNVLSALICHLGK